jgi:hypothetical protein
LFILHLELHSLRSQTTMPHAISWSRGRRILM